VLQEEAAVSGVASEAFVLRPGEGRQIIPAGRPHGFRVGSVASRKLNLYTPAAMVGYFDELSDATKMGHLDPEVLSEIAGRYAMEVLGPASERYL
jgi:hypothetical protein